MIGLYDGMATLSERDDLEVRRAIAMVLRRFDDPAGDAVRPSTWSKPGPVNADGEAAAAVALSEPPGLKKPR